METRNANELFIILLERWDSFNHAWDWGICEKIDTLHCDNTITNYERSVMKNLLLDQRDIAIKDFGAWAYPASYWWNDNEMDKRKSFVEYLIQYSKV